MLNRSALALLALVLVAGVAPGEPAVCTCPDGKACYHYLRAPVPPPEDPCRCPACEALPGTCSSRLPPDWDPTCFANGKMECFLRRHAASFDLVCSEMLEGSCACRNPHPERCPRCGPEGAPISAERLALVRKQVEVERRLLGPRRKFVLVTSPHFYLVTDVKTLKVRTQERNWRVMDTHEIAHLFIQRAEYAYDDFVAAFGKDVVLPRPSAIYLLDDEQTKQEVAKAYIGLPEPELCYGGNYDSIAGGYPYNCCAFSRGKYKQDLDLHHQLRHLVGHLLISCWKVVGGSNDILPRWVYAGAGHWLSRLPPLLSGTAAFCAGEGVQVSDSGEKWPERLRLLAGDPRKAAVEMMFAANTLDAVTLDLHMRAWSVFDLFLREDRARFVAFLARLRGGEDHRTALMAAMGIGAEEFDRRWRDRILSRRPSVAPTAAEIDAANPSARGAAERAGIRAETDPALLAAKIRELKAVDDPLTAEVLVPYLAYPVEVVRETAVVVLARTTTPAVLAWLREKGLPASTGLARANVARVLAAVGDREAGEALRPLLGDPYFLVRAHAALGLSRIGDEAGLPRIAGLLDDSAPAVRVAAMDALKAYGPKARAQAKDVADHLGDGAWQSRSAAAECLGALGEPGTVEALIARMEIEGGRVRRDIRTALKAITRDDLGSEPKHWRDWWEKERGRFGEGPPAAPAPATPDGYAGEPTLYGISVFSESVGFAVDTSGSMAYAVKVDEAWLRKHRRTYPAQGTKYDLVRWEIEATLRSLQPRTRFGIWFFRSTLSAFHGEMVPATPDNVTAAGGRLEAEAPPPTTEHTGRLTNTIGVLRMILSAKEGDPPSAGFADNPDTLFLLTDGKPTAGDITEPDVLLSWFAERNRFARMRLFVVTFGSRESGLEFLKNLAEQHGGTFSFVPEVR